MLKCLLRTLLIGKLQVLPSFTKPCALSSTIFFWPCWNRSPDYLPICILISHAGHSPASLPSPVDHKTPRRFLTPLGLVPWLHLVFNHTEHLERLKETSLFWLFICCRIHTQSWSLPLNARRRQLWLAAAGTVVQSHEGIIPSAYFVIFFSLLGQC